MYRGCWPNQGRSAALRRRSSPQGWIRRAAPTIQTDRNVPNIDRRCHDGGVTDEIGSRVDPGVSPVRDALSQLRLRELLIEVQDRVEQIVEGRDRLRGPVEPLSGGPSGPELGG